MLFLLGTALPAAADSERWQGWSIGLSAGAGAFVWNTNTLDASTGDTTNIDGAGGEGVLGDVFVAYDHVVHGNFVLGTQFEATYADVKLSGTSTDAAGVTTTEWGPERMFSVLGRVGYIVNPSTLFYGLVGWTNANFELDWKTTDPTASPGGAVGSDHNGLSLGVGLQTFVAENTSIRAEYRFTEFDTFTYSDPSNGDTTSLDPSMHVGRIAVVFHH